MDNGSPAIHQCARIASQFSATAASNSQFTRTHQVHGSVPILVELAANSQCLELIWTTASFIWHPAFPRRSKAHRRRCFCRRSSYQCFCFPNPKSKSSPRKRLFRQGFLTHPQSPCRISRSAPDAAVRRQSGLSFSSSRSPPPFTETFFTLFENAAAFFRKPRFLTGSPPELYSSP